ncbi:MAG: DUF1616 domain-containing protein [Methanotrichaceae archaeon]|nr:DUF1616 domain-containing protein [Methanotrichaceae archaeon]
MILILVVLSPEPVQKFGAYVSLVLVFFLPGYSLTTALFPGKSDINLKNRLALALALNILLAGLATFVLIHTPRGLNPASLVFSLAILTIGLTIAAYLRWSALPRRSRFSLGYDKGPKKFKRKDRQLTTAIILLILGLIVIVISAYGFVANRSSEKDGITDLYIIKPEGDSAKTITDIKAYDPEILPAIIDNQEHRLVNYTLVLSFNKTTIFSKDFPLEHNKSWQGPISYSFVEPGDMKKLELLLYKEGDFAKPYRTKDLLVNVSKNAINDSEKVNPSGKDSVTLDEEGRFVVLGEVSYNDRESKKSRKTSISSAIDTRTSSDSQNGLLDEEQLNETKKKTKAAPNQEDEFSIKGSSSSNTDNSIQMQSNLVDSKQETIETTPIIGIEINQPDRKMKEIDTSADTETSRTALEVKGDKSQAPLQTAVLDTAEKLGLAIEKSLNLYGADKKDAKSTDLKNTNSIDASLPSNQNVGPSEEKINSKSGALFKDGSLVANEPANPVNAKSNSGSLKTDLAIDSKTANSQSKTANAKTIEEPSVPARKSNAEEQEGSNENKKPQNKKQSEMEKEIDSWVDSRDSSPSDQDKNSYISKNIRYVKEGPSGKAVLGSYGKSYVATGSNSKAPMKLG